MTGKRFHIQPLSVELQDEELEEPLEDEQNLLIDLPPAVELAPEEEAYLIDQSDGEFELLKSSVLPEFADVETDPIATVEKQDDLEKEEDILEDMDGKVYPVDERFSDTNKLNVLEEIDTHEELEESGAEVDIETAPIKSDTEDEEIIPELPILDLPKTDEDKHTVEEEKDTVLEAEQPPLDLPPPDWEDEVEYNPPPPFTQEVTEPESEFAHELPDLPASLDYPVPIPV